MAYLYNLLIQLQYIIDEIVVDGMVTETNINEIVSTLRSMSEHAEGGQVKS